MKENLSIIKNMLKLVKPLKFPMFCAIFCGTVGHLLAISIPVLAVVAVLSALGMVEIPVEQIFTLLLINSLLRGVFAYLEQQRNHFIAFTILAIIRDQVFTALRRLCPAKLDGKNRGNLISIITADIELLEVFYAHTISPVVIATLIALIMTGIFAQFQLIFAVIALVAYVTVGCLLPCWMSRKKSQVYLSFREKSGELSSYYLDSIRGMDEILQYNQGEKRLSSLLGKSKELDQDSLTISRHEGKVNGVADSFVLFFGGLMLVVSSTYSQNLLDVLLPTVLMMSSFGPFLSLSKLSVGLSRTLAAAKRVEELLQEEPEVTDVVDGKTPDFHGLNIQDLSFSYEDTQILEQLNMTIEDKQITGIYGKSGCGKSTLLKLIMGFWQSQGISLGDTPLEEVDTKHLRSLESYMTQDSDMFRGTIMENIKIAKLDATQEEVETAAKAASLHDFILTLPQGYDSKIGELGSKISGGERQRIGLARAFLHQAPLLLLDEPTSNLDSLNESAILRAIQAQEKAVILISHRQSTQGICQVSYHLEERK